MKILITGVAGFIGMHVAKKLLQSGHELVGVDNINDYYDIGLKKARLKELGVLFNYEDRVLTGENGFQFVKLDLEDTQLLNVLFKDYSFDIVINLAAQAGVRFSITNPETYIKSNVVGFYNILEACRSFPVKHLIYASSSSVYGNSSGTRLSVDTESNKPVSLYAATKKTNEIMSYTYSHLFKVPCTGLRFFTVYGPYGRPDMAYFSFAKKIIDGKTIELYNGGTLKRDFTFIDDIVSSIEKLIPKPPTELDEYYRILNVGNAMPVDVNKFVDILSSLIGLPAIVTNVGMQPGDVYETFADTTLLRDIIDFSPNTPIEIGLKHFVDWLKDYQS